MANRRKTYGRQRQERLAGHDAAQTPGRFKIVFAGARDPETFDTPEALGRRIHKLRGEQGLRVEDVMLDRQPGGGQVPAIMLFLTDDRTGTERYLGAAIAGGMRREAFEQLVRRVEPGRGLASGEAKRQPSVLVLRNCA